MTSTENAHKDITVTPTPYEPGNHCIFYAVQDANLFFNGTGLPREQRDTFKKNQPRIDALIRKLNPGQDTEQPISFLKRSLVYTLKMLDRERITSPGIYCAPNVASVLSEASFIKRRGIPVASVDNTRDYIVSTPAIIVTDRPQQGDCHMWFCRDDQMWREGFQKHMDKSIDVLIAVILLGGKKP